ncbi:hypothetical protein PVK06_036263 [Gossypium arboreum]|uniref:Reverse transcriptase domain-containing protein n=1 Tax=Gossypium arboreum TaxID=29729 RepID=A0ABR0NJ37_GOSAR|nr:hypothetical protein PVK06_036263 [Gossypium arboreum]
MKLVSQNQASFVMGRNISDNIIVTQEVVHSMKNFKGKKFEMIFKIDLEKAYDKLRWDFLKEMLSTVSFSTTLISVILNCVSSSSFQVLWNEMMAEAFKPFSWYPTSKSPIALFICSVYKVDGASNQ